MDSNHATYLPTLDVTRIDTTGICSTCKLCAECVSDTDSNKRKGRLPLRKLTETQARWTLYDTSERPTIQVRHQEKSCLLVLDPRRKSSVLKPV